MRRFFLVILSAVLLCCLVSCSIPAYVHDDGIAVTGAYKLFSFYDESYAILIEQFAEGIFSLDKCSYSYKDTYFSIALIPLNLIAEKNSVILKYGEEELIFNAAEGELKFQIEGAAEQIFTNSYDGKYPTIGYVGVEKEVFFDTTAVIDGQNILSLLKNYGGERISLRGRAELRFIYNITDIYLFAGYYEEDIMACAVLCDLRGNFITSI